MCRGGLVTTATPFADLHCVYLWASGPRYSDCVFLGRRHRDAYGSRASDSDFWIMVNRSEGTQDGLTYARWGPWTNFLTYLWQSKAGVVYIADATAKAIQVLADVMDHARGMRCDPLTFWPEGVWGLDDEHVWAWGSRKDAAGKIECVVSRYDGKTWSELPLPGFVVVQMHGLAPDLIYAAGQQGSMARWDGRAWTPHPTPTGEPFTDVFVAGPEELYATGRLGSLLEGDGKTWRLVTRTMDERLPYHCVAKWHDELWVGGGPLGLFRRKGKTDELELLKPKVGATSFDARDDLVITCDNRIVGTGDGANFRAAGIDILAKQTAAIDIALR
jgi:hypothetical protein